MGTGLAMVVNPLLTRCQGKLLKLKLKLQFGRRFGGPTPPPRNRSIPKKRGMTPPVLGTLQIPSQIMTMVGPLFPPFALDHTFVCRRLTLDLVQVWTSSRCS